MANQKMMEQEVQTANGIRPVEFSLPDSASSAAAIVEAAFEYTARKMHLENGFR